MRRHTHRGLRTISVCCMTICLIALGTAVEASSDKAMITQRVTSEALSDVTLETAALQMSIDDNISVDESRSRMVRQQEMSDLAQSASVELTTDYASAWLDQATHGSLVVQSTDDVKLQRWLSGIDRALVPYVRTKVVERSLNTIVDQARRIQIDLDSSQLPYTSIQIDDVNNRVDVVGPLSTQSKEANLVELEVSKYPGATYSLAPGQRMASSCQSTRQKCDPPRPSRRRSN